MNGKEILAEFNMQHCHIDYKKPIDWTILEGMIDAALAAEREACATVAEQHDGMDGKAIACKWATDVQANIYLSARQLGCLSVVIDAALAAEREACAKVAEMDSMKDWAGGSTGNAVGTAKNIAAAIRARRP